MYSFTVPVNYTGRTLVCTARGWPAPEVEWHKDGLPLPRDFGVVSEPSAMSATVSARLTWTREFMNSDAGSYECVVHKPNTEVALTSQVVQLNAGPPAPNQPSVTTPVDPPVDSPSSFGVMEIAITVGAIVGAILVLVVFLLIVLVGCCYCRRTGSKNIASEESDHTYSRLVSDNNNKLCEIYYFHSVLKLCHIVIVNYLHCFVLFP